MVVAEQRLGVGVDEHDPPVAAGGDRGVRQAFEHGAQRGFAAAQPLLEAYRIDGLGGAHAHGREEEGFQVPRIVCVHVHARLGRQAYADSSPRQQ